MELTEKWQQRNPENAICVFQSETKAIIGGRAIWDFFMSYRTTEETLDFFPMPLPPFPAYIAFCANT
jgi:hypothetical protein